MPSRLVREDILTSERVDKLDAAAEVFYRRLLSKVDDYGLYDARPSILRSYLFPLRVDRVREADLSRWIAACVKAGLLALYEHDGRPFMQVLRTRWQARSEPKYPLPPWGKGEPPQAAENSCSQAKTPVPVFGDVVGDVGVTPLPPAGGLAARFDRFWAAYPRKVGKDAARKAFERRKPDDVLVSAMVRAIEAAAASEQWQREGGRFVPHPSTWLNEGRWQDEQAADGGAVAQPWHDTRAGIEAKGEEMGLGRWDEDAFNRGQGMQWPTYKARVFKAAGFEPRRVA